MNHRLEGNTEVESTEKENKFENSENKLSFKDKLSNFLNGFKESKTETKEKDAEKTEDVDDASKKTEKKENDFWESLKVNITPEQVKQAVELSKAGKKNADSGNDGGRTPGEDAWDRLSNKHYLDLDEER